MEQHRSYCTQCIVFVFIIIFLHGADTCGDTKKRKQAAGVKEVEWIRVKEVKHDKKEKSNAGLDIEVIDDSIAGLHRSKLPPFKTDTASDTFSFPEKSIPVPRSGEKISNTFSGDDTGNLEKTEGKAEKGKKAEKDSKYLEVVDFSPIGSVEIALNIKIRFSLPMKELGGEKRDYTPVNIEPETKGEFVWRDTKTLVFKPEGMRLPGSTLYKVSINKNASSIDGRMIRGKRVFTFSTPPLKIVDHFPKGSQSPTDLPLFIEFNQRIEPEVITDYIQIKSNGKEIGFKPADQEIIPEYSRELKTLVDNAQMNHWLLLSPEKRLSKSSGVEVILENGAVSAEGPLKRASNQRVKFRTYDPFVIEYMRCRKDSLRCDPDEEWKFITSSPIDKEGFTDSMVSIKPELEDNHISVRDSTIAFWGDKSPDTEYTIKFSDRIKDKFGQSLSGSREKKVFTGHKTPRINSQYPKVSILDPEPPKLITFKTLNYEKVRFRLYRVRPCHYERYKEVLRHRFNRNLETLLNTVKWRKLADDTVAVECRPDTLTQNAIDLREHLPEIKGHYVLLISPVEYLKGIDAKRRFRNKHLFTWLQDTDIGLDAWNGQREYFVMTTSIKTGKALPGVSIIAGNRKDTTDRDGIGQIPRTDEGDRMIIASKGGDTAFLALQSAGGINLKRDIFYIFDPRGLYSPGDSVYLKGWVREADLVKGGELSRLEGISEIDYKVKCFRDKVLEKGKAELSKTGGFDLAFKIPDIPGLRSTKVSLKAGKYRDSHSIRVMDYRKPEFRVNVKKEEGPYFSNEDFSVIANASYYSGGNLRDAEVRWDVSVDEYGHSSFTPEKRSDFSFGNTTPWFWNWNSDYSKGSRDHREIFSGATDNSGSHEICINSDLSDISVAKTLKIKTEITDVNRQTWSAETSALIHPAKYYAGLKTSKYNYSPGKPVSVEWLVCDLNEEIKAGVPVVLKAERVKRVYEKREMRDKVLESYSAEKRSSDKSLEWKFTPERGGAWRITAILTDEKGRKNKTVIKRWVSHEKEFQNHYYKRVKKQKIRIIPDRERYSPGDTAELLILSPFAPAEGMVFLKHWDIEDKRRVTLEKSKMRVSIPIKESYMPNVTPTAFLTGSLPRKGKKNSEKGDSKLMPVYAEGKVNLEVSTEKRELDVCIDPDKSRLSPGESTWVDIMVKDFNGDPVRNSEVAVAVVDKAVLDLTDHRIRSPIHFFYMTWITGFDLRGYHNRSYVVLSDTGDIATWDKRGGLMGGGYGSGSGEVSLRSDKNPLACFHPEGYTDKKGNLRVGFRLSDNLTEYSVIAVAASGKRRFGMSQSSISVSKPLMVRPSPPRFLYTRDTFELPFVVQNKTSESADIGVFLRAEGADVLTSGFRLKIPSEDRAEVRFTCAAEMPGEAGFQVMASSDVGSDASMFEIPIYNTGAVNESAEYGSITEKDFSIPVKRPENVHKEYGGLSLSLSSTAIQELTDAFLYLYDYEYSCSEQIASRVIAVTSLYDVLEAFDLPDLPSESKIKERLSSDIRKLSDRQSSSRGFRTWAGSNDISPYISLHVAHAFVRAKTKGLGISRYKLRRAERFINTIDSHIPDDYPEGARTSLIAYSLYIKALVGGDTSEEAAGLVKSLSTDSMDSQTLGWLLYAISDKTLKKEAEMLKRHIYNRIQETGVSAHFSDRAVKEGGRLIMKSSRKTDAVILSALMESAPKSHLIPKLVRGLLAHRKAGRWNGTHENCFVLTALSRYFKEYESQTPDFKAMTWLGSKYAGEHEFRERSLESYNISIPMEYLPKDSGQRLTISKKGKGRMYYRVGMRSLPKSEEVEPAENGFSVNRLYQDAEDKGRVVKSDDRTWRIKAGALVRVSVRVAAQSRRYHVALVDRLPAGLEPVNPEFAVSSGVGEVYNKNSKSDIKRFRYDHKNMRDEQVEVFNNSLRGGIYEFVYYARAITPGSFTAPPAKAEEMYSPEVFGRTGSGRVVVSE